MVEHTCITHLIQTPMDTIVYGTFTTQRDAERCVHELQSELDIPMDDISYLYRDSDDDSFEVYDGMSDIVGGGVTGATIGASLGTLAGLATVAGVIPFMGPVFVAGPLIVALGIGAGAIVTTAAGAVTGGLVGALVEWGVPKDIARSYQDKLNSGEILVTVSTDDAFAVENKFNECNATSITTHSSLQEY